MAKKPLKPCYSVPNGAGKKNLRTLPAHSVSFWIADVELG